MRRAVALHALDGLAPLGGAAGDLFFLEPAQKVRGVDVTQEIVFPDEGDRLASIREVRLLAGGQSTLFTRQGA